MKIKVIIASLLLICFSCKENINANVETALKRSMTDFLYSTVQYDSSKVKYRVDSVIYFEDKDFYDCEFTVQVISAEKDTTGVMGATVSKDFKTVKRRM